MARLYSSKKRLDWAATVMGSIGLCEPVLSQRGSCRLPLTTQWKSRYKGDEMLIKAKALKGYSLKSLDGDIGSASEFFFDDQYWAIRYLVANTASWLSGRKVLISPYSLDGVNTAEEKVFVRLNRKQIEESPSIDTDEPVSRHMRPPTTDTMTFRIIGAAHTCGGAMRILSWITPDGSGLSRKQRNGPTSSQHRRGNGLPFRRA